MADPISYTPSYSFTDYQESNPRSPLPGDEVDSNLFDIAAAIADHAAAITDVRRSDGALKNAIVTYDSLSTDMKSRLAAVGFDGSEEQLEAISAGITATPDVHNAVATPYISMFGPKVPLMAFTVANGSTRIEIGDEGDPDLNTEVIQRALEGVGYDSLRIPGLFPPAGNINIRGDALEIPAGVWWDGAGALQNLNKIASRLTVVGEGTHFHMGGTMDPANGQYWWYGKVTNQAFFWDTNTAETGWAIRFRTLAGNTVAPQDSTMIDDNHARGAPEGMLDLLRGALPITWFRNRALNCGGPIFRMDGGFNVQSVQLIGFSSDNHRDYAIELINIPDTGSVTITNLKTEMNVNTQVDGGTTVMGKKQILIQDCDKGASFLVEGSTHISARVESGYRRKPQDLITVIGSNRPNLEWKNCEIRMAFGAPDDPGDPDPNMVVYGSETWSYSRNSGSMNEDHLYINKVPSTGGHWVFGTTEAYDADSVEDVSVRVTGPTPAYSLYETDADADEKAWLERATGGNLAFSAVSDAGVATNYRAVNRDGGAVRNIQDAVPNRPGAYTVATKPSAATHPSCQIVVTDPAASKGRYCYSDASVWRYISDDSAV